MIYYLVIFSYILGILVGVWMHPKQPKQRRRIWVLASAGRLVAYNDITEVHENYRSDLTEFVEVKKK